MIQCTLLYVVAQLLCITAAVRAVDHTYVRNELTVDVQVTIKVGGADNKFLGRIIPPGGTDVDEYNNCSILGQTWGGGPKCVKVFVRAPVDNCICTFDMWSDESIAIKEKFDDDGNLVRGYLVVDDTDSSYVRCNTARNCHKKSVKDQAEDKGIDIAQPVIDPKNYADVLIDSYEKGYGKPGTKQIRPPRYPG